MASESTCDRPGPLGTGATVGGRKTRATCSYHIGHTAGHSWKYLVPFRIRKVRGRWRGYCAVHPRRPELNIDYLIEARTFKAVLRFLEIHATLLHPRS